MTDSTRPTPAWTLIGLALLLVPLCFVMGAIISLGRLPTGWMLRVPAGAIVLGALALGYSTLAGHREAPGSRDDPEYRPYQDIR